MYFKKIQRRQKGFWIIYSKKPTKRHDKVVEHIILSCYNNDVINYRGVDICVYQRKGDRGFPNGVTKK